MSENKLPPRLKFYQNHRPNMESGSYSIDISGSITHSKISSDNDFVYPTPDNAGNKRSWKFNIYGEKFAINEQDIRAVFPAPNSTGDYESILPHIVLNRNTLPWEREALTNNEEFPWMALLLFDEDQRPEKKIIKVKDLNLPANGEIFKDDQQVTVIDVQKSILQKILPTTAELKLLAHTRQGVDTDKPAGEQLVGEENAVVFCNRLPQHGKRSTMHLVSVEDKYGATSFNYGTETTIRLVSLKSWEFFAIEHFKITSKTLIEVKKKASTDDYDKISTLLGSEFSGTETVFVEQVATAAGLAAIDDVYKSTLVNFAAFNKTFDGILTHLDKQILTLRLPDKGNTDSKKYLSQGMVPMVHQFRNGNRSVSWYRGPFLPTPGLESSVVRNLRPETSDELSQFNKTHGMFDITYSAAWEIGRLMALASKDFSTSLFQWKRLIAQHKHKERQTNEKSHLPVFAHSHNHEAEAPLWENHLFPWLTKLINFLSIPANYLIPEENLLPKESIRFFHIDKDWQVATALGAFSIGGDWDKLNQTDDNDFNDFLDLNSSYLTGFLLRSDVVDGWPGLLIDGIDDQGNKHDPLRRRLSKDILLCLFKINLKQVIFHQKPEVLHFGFLKRNGEFFKRERDTEGKEIIEVDGQGDEIYRIKVPWKTINQDPLGNDRVIDISKLSEDLNKKDIPAAFAMNMIEGVPRVTFDLE